MWFYTKAVRELLRKLGFRCCFDFFSTYNRVIKNPSIFFFVHMTLSLISENGGLIHHTHGHRQFPVIRRISELYRDFTNPEVLFTLTFWGNLLTRSVIASAWVLQVTVLLCVVDQRKSKCYHDVPYVWISMRRAKVSWKHEGHVPRSQFPIASPQRGSLDIGILSSPY